MVKEKMIGENEALPPHLILFCFKISTNVQEIWVIAMKTQIAQIQKAHMNALAITDMREMVSIAQVLIDLYEISIFLHHLVQSYLLSIWIITIRFWSRRKAKKKKHNKNLSQYPNLSMRISSNTGRRKLH